MVGFARAPGSTGKRMCTLVAVLFLCSSVVSQSSGAAAIAARELVGDPSLIKKESVLLEPGAESQFVASTALSTSAPATTEATTFTATSAPAPTELAPTPSLTPSPFLKSRVVGSTEDATLSDVTSASTTDTQMTSSGSGSGSGAEPAPALASQTTTATTSGSTSSSDVPARTSSGSDSNSDISSSGNDDYESGSGSKRTYACTCKDVRKVSLMGQSDYCLAKSANVAYKCGNTAVKENGMCPRIGAQPCSDTGHVLVSDSICAFDDVDNVYKCVASKEDLEIKKNGGKRTKKKNSTSAQNNSTAADTTEKSGAASLHRSPSAAFHAITLVATLVLGTAALL